MALHPHKVKQRRQGGFTLIELMIAMVILAILAGVALSAYQNHMAQARRADATTMLTQLATSQAQHFLDNKSYAASLTALGFPSATANTENGYYVISIAAATGSCAIATCYLLQAVPQSVQTSDVCGTLTLNSQGVKLPATNGCWTR